MRTTTERRFNQAQLRLLPTHVSSSPGSLTGYASVFNSLSSDLGGFAERVSPGAFDKSLRSGVDCKALVNHDPSLIVGRTRSGTLRLSTDAVGLRMECDLPDTSVGRDLYASVQRGDLSEMSFAFQCEDESWCDEPDPEDRGRTVPTRTLRSVRLMDVSVVCSPAYPATSVHANSRALRELVASRPHEALFPDGVPVEVRSHVRALPADSRERRRRLTGFVLGL